jgi:hypothetical protein
MTDIKFNVIAKKSDNLQELYSKVLELDIPKDVGENYEGMETDPNIYAKSKFNLTSEGLPYVSIGLGKVRDTGEDAVALFFATGVTPKDALAEIQQAVFDHKIQLDLHQPQKFGRTFNFNNTPREADPDPIFCS